MTKRTVTLPLAALTLLVPSLWASARADGAQATQAGTVVVVTPSSPVVVSAASGQAAPAPVAPPVQAPGATEMPPAAPPHNQPWSNVSNINGQLVPVGEHNRYLYSYRKNNIMVNPFGPFVGYYDASFSHGVTQNVALSLGVSGWNIDDTTGLQITASAPIYFRRTFSGPFLEPGLMFRTTSDHADTNYDSFDATDCLDCTSSSSSDSWVGPELLVGWHWMFDSGLNIVVASGMAKRLDRNDGDEGIEFNGYFRAGYAF